MATPSIRLAHQDADDGRGGTDVAGQCQNRGGVLGGGLDAPWRDLMPQRRAARREVAGLGEVGEEEAHPALRSPGPSRNSATSPAEQIRPALLECGDELEGRVVERRFVPVRELGLLVLVQARHQGEGLPVLERRVGRWGGSAPGGDASVAIAQAPGRDIARLRAIIAIVARSLPAGYNRMAHGGGKWGLAPGLLPT